MKVREKKWIRIRIILVTGVFLCGFGTILARAYQFQVIKRDELRAMARSAYTAIVRLPAERGTIYDCNNHELAISTDVCSVYAHPRQIHDLRKTSAILAKLLGLKHRSLYKRLRSDKAFVWVKRKVDPAKAGQIKELKLAGVGITKEKGRYYPARELAAQLLGFVGTDNNGLEGIEKKYDKALSGPCYELIQMRDALGRPFFIKRASSKSKPLHNLVLTIDKDIQYRAEKSLVFAVQESRAKGGQCVVMDPRSGEILAMAVVPRFNPNIFSVYPPETWRNRIVTDCFEPGSSIKAFLVAGALEDGVLYPNSRLYCEEGRYKVADRVIHDTHKYGTLTVSEIISFSSNIGAIKIGQQLGYDRFYQYLMKFGFGSKTGIDLLGERRGSIRPPDKAGPVEQVNAFFGQGISVTALQLATAMSCIANGGVLMRPYVVKKITDSYGRPINIQKPKMVRRVISQATARNVTVMLQEVVSANGTAPRAAIEGYKVAGKTGTAQKVDEATKRYSKTKYMAIFVGFAPAENPRIVIAVVIDEPKGIPYGGVVAAPVFKEVGLWALNHLKVNPSVRVEMPQSSFEISKNEASSPASCTAKVTAGEGTKTATAALRGCLPDFRGKTMREVLCEARRLGVSVKIEGTGFAYSQSPRAGVSLRQVRYVKVRFRPPRSS